MEVVSSYRPSQGLTLISGPSRGGKSRWAEHLLSEYNDVTYVATSSKRQHDQDWQNRLKKHQDRRPKEWTVIESERELIRIVKNLSTDGVLIDSLGGFVACHLDQSAKEWDFLVNELIQTLKQHSSKVLIVIEETGWGVVPGSVSGCLFRDRLGKMAQDLEEFSIASWLVIQGRALNLKELGISVP